MKTIKFSELPAVGAPLDSGIFAGVITHKGVHVAVVLLPDRGEDLTWNMAKEWVKKQGGELPTRSVAALLFANCKTQLTNCWHWTADEDDAFFVWDCHFGNGDQSSPHKSYELAAVCVRLIPITA